MEGQKKVNENCIVQIRIRYASFTDFETQHESYIGNGKVNKVTFLPTGKLEVEVDIGLVSAKDYRTP